MNIFKILFTKSCNCSIVYGEISQSVQSLWPDNTNVSRVYGISSSGWQNKNMRHLLHTFIFLPSLLIHTWTTDESKDRSVIFILSHLSTWWREYVYSEDIVFIIYVFIIYSQWRHRLEYSFVYIVDTHNK